MDASKRLTLVAAITGTFVVGIDATVVNVALPAIEDDLGGGLAGQQWVVNIYLLFLGSLILIGGSLGDLLGVRRIFRVGVAGFGVVSVLCAIAPTIETLVAFRALQGVFGALLTPSALAIIVATFPPDERGHAIGTWTAWSGIAMVIGPLVGGQIVDSTSWRAIFALSVPFVVVALAMSTRIPGSDVRRDARIDYVGATLAALGFAGPTFALIEQPRLGWDDPGVWVPLIGGLVLLGAFVAWEARHPEPMLPLRLFRVRNFAYGNLETLAMYAGLGVMFFFLVIYLQQVAGFSAFESGLAVLPVTVVMFLLSGRFGALADRYGPRAFMGLGPLVAAGGLLMLLLDVDADIDYLAEVLPGLLVFSLGLTMTVAPLTATVLAAADEHNAGIASAVNNAVARLAGLLATAAVGAVIAAQFASALERELAGRPLSPQAGRVVRVVEERALARVDSTALPPRERALLERASERASTEAFRIALGIAAGLVAAGGLIGLIGIRDPRRRPVAARGCPGGQLAGQPGDAAGVHEGAVA